MRVRGVAKQKGAGHHTALLAARTSARFYFFVFFRSFALFASGSEDTVNWNKTIGDTSTDVATKVLVDANDHVWVFGYTHNGTDYDWRFIHFDPTGNIILDVSSNGKPGDDMIYSADFYLQ